MSLPTYLTAACGRAFATGRTDDLRGLLDRWASTLPILIKREASIRRQIAEHDGFIRYVSRLGAPLSDTRHDGHEDRSGSAHAQTSGDHQPDGGHADPHPLTARPTRP